MPGTVFKIITPKFHLGIITIFAVVRIKVEKNGRVIV